MGDYFRLTPKLTVTRFVMRQFKFLRQEIEIDVTKRNLPHWEQPEVCYFLTFRTVDSMPEEVMDQWSLERHDWLIRRGIDPVADEDWHPRIETLSCEDRAEFHARFSRQIKEHLDKGYGECVLRQPVIRRIVCDALHFFDEERYRLGGFVVMPNHAHVLVQCLGDTRLKPMGYGLKRFTAREINKNLERKGHFWQGETYDHIVRSPQQFWHYRRYIEDNPAKARIGVASATVFLPEVDVPF
jgi:putative transposase